MLAIKILCETLVFWLGLFLYVYAFVFRVGAIGGIVFYPPEVRRRVVELGLTTEKEIRRRQTVGLIVGILVMLVLYFISVVLINGADTFFAMAWQCYLLFVLMELFDLFVIDVAWVAGTSFWDIDGTEDLRHLWHNPKEKIKKKGLGILVAGVPFALILAGVFYGVRLLGLF